jgi:hypothetical protein
MKHASLNRRTTRQSPSFSHDHPRAGPNGVSLASPAYGIDFLDRQQKDARSEPEGQAGPIHTPIPRGPSGLNPGSSGLPLLQRGRPSPPLQAKLLVAPASDQYERDADRVANEVVQQLNAPISLTLQQTYPIQRQTMPPQKEELKRKPLLQRWSSTGGTTATPELEKSIQRAHGRGQPLANDLREPMERAFGANFGNVRVHTDAHADYLNQSIRAKAFTMGQDIFFRQRAYEPGSRDGQTLLAHELSHVVQQRENIVQRKIGFELETAIPVSKYIPGEDNRELTPRAEDELREQLAADSHKLKTLAGIETGKTRVTGHTPFLTWADQWHATTDNAGDRIGEASDANLEMVTHASEIETPDEAVARLSSAQAFVRKIYGEEPELNRVLIDGHQVYGLPSPEVLEQLFGEHPERQAILQLFENARELVIPDAMVQVNMGVALSQLPGLLLAKDIQFGATSAKNLLITEHKKRGGFTSRTTTQEQKMYNTKANNIHGFQNELLEKVAGSKFLRAYKKEPYWADLHGWLSLLINVLTRAAYFPYSQLLKNMTPILSKSPLHLVFQSVLDQVRNGTGEGEAPKAVKKKRERKAPTKKGELRKDVEKTELTEDVKEPAQQVKKTGLTQAEKELAGNVQKAIRSDFDSWNSDRKKEFPGKAQYVFARTVHEEEDFFKNQPAEIAGKAFVQLGDVKSISMWPTS